MFQSFRNQKRWLMLFAMILIIPAFVFIGINGYHRLNPDANAIAKVAGVAIQPEEFDQAKRQFIEQKRVEAGGSVDASSFDTPEINHQILANLTTNRALNAQLANNYMGVSEADAVAVIKNAPAFQRDGQFRPELYENYLAARGKSDAMFVQELRHDLARELLINGVKQTVFLPKKTLENINNILREERTVRTMVFDPASYMDKVKVTPEQMKAYYDSHLDQFKAPQTLDIEYVVFSPDTVKVTAKPTEDELENFYNQNKNRFTSEETRRASHILIAPDMNEKDAVKADADAKAKAEKLMAEIKANPESFSEVARKESADTGSAEHGGDLDFFSRGQMVPEFDKAVFEAKKGDLVGPVKTEFGYHIINVTDVHPAGVKPFAEVKSDIEHLWELQKKQEAFAEGADDFSNMVYEQSDSLAPEVEKYGLTLQKANGLTKTGFLDSKYDTPVLTKRVIEELFSPDSLQEKRNTQAVEVAANTLVSARIVKENPAHQKTFDEVKAEIESELQLQEASKLAAAAGEAKLKDVEKSKNLDGFSKPIIVSRLDPKGQAEELITAEMQPAADKLPAFTGCKEDNGNYVISYVEKSVLPSYTDENADKIKGQVLQIQAIGDELAYYDALKKLLNLEILKKEYDFKMPKQMN